MTALSQIIHSIIQQNGPIGIDQYMSLCLAHAEHGYYMKKDPLGAAGDFTTAPEISQLFGDMIGLWVLNTYLRLERPLDITLIECGPGRGTLMSDVLRIARQDPTFAQAVNVHMVETSPSLTKTQKTALSYTPDLECTWHDNLNDITPKGPVIIIANEFFDALPFKQYQYFKDKGWYEVVVGQSKDSKSLAYGVKSAPYINDLISKANLPAPKDNDIFEHAPVREMLAMQMANLIEQNSGAALAIDYGHEISDYGDTFQAVHQHEYSDPLTLCGDSDLTSHVDFGALLHRIQNETKLACHPIMTQGEFLKTLGIDLWHQKLSYSLDNQDDINQLEAQKKRLIDDDEMGALFKVMSFERL